MLSHRAAVLCLVPLLAACSLSWHDSHVNTTSSVHLQPDDRTTLRIRTSPAHRLAVTLRGAGPGAIAFEVHTPEGMSVAKGSLGIDDTARCQTSEGALDVEFAAGAEGGIVTCEVYGADGVALELQSH